MTKGDWIKRISEILDKEHGSSMDRLGRTPVIALADEVRYAYSTDPALVDALATLIRNSRADFQKLQDLCRIARIGKVKQRIVVASLNETFANTDGADIKVRIALMNTLLDLEHRFSPADLEKADDIRDAAPVQWLNAWFECHLFKADIRLFDTCTERLFKENKLTLRALSGLLDAWYQEMGVELVLRVRQWKDEFKNDPDRCLLDTWIETWLEKESAHKRSSLNTARNEDRSPVEEIGSELERMFGKTHTNLSFS